MPRTPKFEGSGLGTGQGGDQFTASTQPDIEELSVTAQQIERGPTVTAEEARNIFKEDLFGPEEAVAAGFALAERIPQIPFTAAELMEGKERGEQLIYFPSSIEEKGVFGRRLSVPATMGNMSRLFRDAHGESIIVPPKSDTGDDYFKSQMPREGWRLVSKEFIEGTRDMSYLDQMEEMISYLEKGVHKYHPMPSKVQEEITHFTPSLYEDKVMLGRMGISEFAQWIAAWALNSEYRERAVEAVYRLIITKVRAQHTIDFSATSSVSKRGRAVFVGRTEKDTIEIFARDIRDHDKTTGLFCSYGH